MQAKLVLLASALLLVSAGCVGVSENPNSTATETLEPGAYVSVTEVPDEYAESATEEEKAVFSNLSEPKQDEFLAALNQSNVKATAWESGTEIRYVHYEESWYSVEVHIV
ncbi:MAG: hypothetical protein ABEI52_08460 [Halobacteriaceae archaeon]